MSNIDTFIQTNKNDILEELTFQVNRLIKFMKLDPKEYTEHGCDGPSVDIRLCVDFRTDKASWVVRTGLADYDQYHSDYCAASCVTPDTDPKELLEELVDDILSQ